MPSANAQERFAAKRLAAARVRANAALHAYGVGMAWMWWLLAPVLTTAAGAVCLWWRGQRLARSAGWRTPTAIAEHHAFLEALPQGRAGEPMPLNLVLLHAPADEAGVVGS